MTRFFPSLRTLGDLYGVSASSLSRLSALGVDVCDPLAVQKHFLSRADQPGRKPAPSATILSKPAASVAVALEELVKSIA